MSAPSDSTRDERRWTFGAWLTLAIATGYLLCGVLYTLAAFQQPTDGWNMANDLTTGWVPILNQGGADALHLGDRILAIEGLNVDMTEPPHHAPPPGWRVGAMARYTVVRDGRTLDLLVPLVQIPAAMLLQFLLFGVDGTSFAGLLALLTGFVIFVLRPGSVAARLLLLIVTYFMGTAFIWLAISTPALAFFPPLLYWAYRGSGMIWPLMFAMIAHTALAFPLRTWPLTRWPRRSLGLLYGLTSIACILSIVISSLALFGSALVANILLMACAVVGATTHNLRSTRDPAIRAQVGWVALGLAGSFVLAGVSAMIGLIVPGLGDWGGYLLFLLLPLSLGIAITRYRLFDIDIIIRRTLVYSILTLMLALVYLGCILLGRWLVAPLTGGSELAIVVSTLAIAALFFPLRRRIQTTIDRRFYRRKYDAQQVLAAFAVAARDETGLDRLSGELQRVVDETMQPEFVGLWLRPADGPPRAADDTA